MYRIIILLLCASYLFLSKLMAQPGSNLLIFRTYAENELAFCHGKICYTNMWSRGTGIKYMQAKRLFKKQTKLGGRKWRFMELGIDSTRTYIVLIGCSKKLFMPYLSYDCCYSNKSYSFYDPKQKNLYSSLKYYDKQERKEYIYITLSFIKISELKRRKPAIKTVIYQNNNGDNISNDAFEQEIYLLDDGKSQLLRIELDPTVRKDIEYKIGRYYLPTIKF